MSAPAGGNNNQRRPIMKFLSIVSIILVASLSFSGAMAEVRSAPVAYMDGDDQLTGYLYWNDAVKGKRPGVLVVHEWWGLNDYARRRADMLAELGYVAFALDMYGEGKVTDKAEEAAAWSAAATQDVDAWRRRVLLGLQVLQGDPRTDLKRVAAVGYCFGGSTVTQLAYTGANIAGVVSFHGSLPVGT